MRTIIKTMPLALLLCGLGFFFTSCDEDQFQESIEPTLEADFEMNEIVALALPPAEATSTLTKSDRCFTFVYPVTFSLRGGTEVTVESDEELEALLTDVRGNMGALRPNFPITVLINGEEDNARTIAGATAFRALVDRCAGDNDGQRDCFTYNFPIDLTIDGATVTVNSGEEWRAAIQEAGRGATIRINFPITVTVGDNTLTLENAVALQRLRRRCAIRNDRVDERGHPCFRYVFPVDLTIDGATVTVNSYQEWRDAVVEAGRGASVEVNFPVTVVVPGQDAPLTVESREELRDIRESCVEDRTPGCFSINFPIRLMVGDRVIRVNSFAEWRRVIARAGGRNVSIVFPIIVTYDDRDRRVLVNNAREYRRRIAACRASDEIEAPCFRFVYPLDLAVGDQVFTVNNLREMARVRAEAGDRDVSFVYPFSVTLPTSDAPTEIEDPEAYARLLASCQE
ncbi:hypothetical protein [Lewinella sp. W8]|uniref:hypothetical protein n=1 Tax=Lewinella sp. W8 TaxID=2528208 RepID=UPI0010688BFA|nr:hypothetical protein [Lewinella sp. W8]MTB51686.1 hypothetical protein [Lewinella sp. W8]